MTRFILVEGPDCCGKSTLVHRLKNTLGWDAKQLMYRPGDQFDRYLREYSLAEGLILERGHISGHVYNQMWGRELLTPREQDVLEKILSLRALTIYARAGLDTMISRYTAREYHQQINMDELATCQSLFDELLDKQPYVIPYASRDWEELDALVARVKQELTA